MRYALTNEPMERATVRLAWTSGSGKPAEKAAVLNIIPGTESRTITVCVNDAIDQFRVVLDDKPCHFELHDVALLTRPADGP